MTVNVRQMVTGHYVRYIITAHTVRKYLQYIGNKDKFIRYLIYKIWNSYKNNKILMLNVFKLRTQYKYNAM